MEKSIIITLNAEEIKTALCHYATQDLDIGVPFTNEDWETLDINDDSARIRLIKADH